MYSYPRAILYAIILWTLTFLVTFLIYPLRTESVMLFSSIRMVAMTLISVALTVMYFRDVEAHLVADGVKLGVIWLVTSLVLDQGPFVWGLMQLSFLDYLADAGLSHLIYPIVTTGAGFLLSADKSMVEDSEASMPTSGPRADAPPELKKPLPHRPSEPQARA